MFISVNRTKMKMNKKKVLLVAIVIIVEIGRASSRERVYAPV